MYEHQSCDGIRATRVVLRHVPGGCRGKIRHKKDPCYVGSVRLGKAPRLQRSARKLYRTSRPTFFPQVGFHRPMARGGSLFRGVRTERRPIHPPEPAGNLTPDKCYRRPEQDSAIASHGVTA